MTEQQDNCFENTHVISDVINGMSICDYELFNRKEEFAKQCFKKDFPELSEWFETADASFDYNEEDNKLAVMVPVVHKYFYDSEDKSEYLLIVDRVIELMQKYFCIEEPCIGFGEVDGDIIIHDDYGKPSTIPMLVDYESGFWEAEVVLVDVRTIDYKEIQRITCNMIQAAVKADAELQIGLKEDTGHWIEEVEFSEDIRTRIEGNE